jgi:DNA polymerase-1
MNRIDPSKVIVVWDIGGSKYRKRLFPEYKKKRSDKRDDDEFKTFIDQVQILRERVFPVLGVSQAVKSGVEADDVIYRLAKYYSMKKKKVTILSGDTDLFQCVSKRVSIISPNRKRDSLVNQKNFTRVTKGLDREQYVSYKMLVGDASDGIPGVPGFGDKTSRFALKHYESAEEAIEYYDELVEKMPRIARYVTFKKAEKIVKRNRKLIDLSVYNSLKRVKASRKLISESELDEKEFRKICKEFGFVYILSNFMDWIEPFKELERE